MQLKESREKRRARKAWDASSYSLCLKINAILGSSTQTNDKCEITKIPFVSCEKDLDIVLSFG